MGEDVVASSFERPASRRARLGRRGSRPEAEPPEKLRIRAHSAGQAEGGPKREVCAGSTVCARGVPVDK